MLQKSPLSCVFSTVSAADDVLLWEMVEYLPISRWGQKLMTTMLLSGESLASQFSCHLFSFSWHALQAKAKHTLVKITISMEALTNVEEKHQEYINV